MTSDRFLTAEQQETVVAAVRLAEKGTSGEIRILLTGYAKQNRSKGLRKYSES